MLIDIASGASWVMCYNHSFSNENFENLFNPSISSSYHHILCDSPLCLYTFTCKLNNPISCDFFQDYVLGQTPRGVLSQDTFALGMHDFQIPNITFGCAYEASRKSLLPNGSIYGLISLSLFPKSF